MGGLTCDNIIQDMIENEHLREIQGALIPSDYWMDEGDRRAIHSVINARAEREMIDGKTGEVLAKITGDVGFGRVFIGGEVRSVSENRDESIVLEEVRNRFRQEAVKLPSTRYRGGLSRAITWQIARQIGDKPEKWRKEGSRVVTWGGLFNNQLLVVLSKLNGLCNRLRADDFGVSGFEIDERIWPSLIKNWATNMQPGAMSLEDAKFFRQPSRYYSRLGNRLQKEEAVMSVPLKPFLAWINDCCE